MSMLTRHGWRSAILAIALAGALTTTASAAVTDLAIDDEAQLSPGMLHATLTGSIAFAPPPAITVASVAAAPPVAAPAVAVAPPAAVVVGMAMVPPPINAPAGAAVVAIWYILANIYAVSSAGTISGPGPRNIGWSRGMQTHPYLMPDHWQNPVPPLAGTQLPPHLRKDLLSHSPTIRRVPRASVWIGRGVRPTDSACPPC